MQILVRLASRIITITNTEELRDTRLRELRLYLKNQQYPEEIVEHGVQKALEKGPIHTELREQVYVTSNQNNIIPFVTTYNPRDYNIFHFMKQIEFNLKSNILHNCKSPSILKCKRGSFY
jgi:translation elongation factor EF-Ts